MFHFSVAILWHVLNNSYFLVSVARDRIFRHHDVPGLLPDQQLGGVFHHPRWSLSGSGTRLASFGSGCIPKVGWALPTKKRVGGAHPTGSFWEPSGCLNIGRSEPSPTVGSHRPPPTRLGCIRLWPSGAGFRSCCGFGRIRILPHPEPGVDSLAFASRWAGCLNSGGFCRHPRI